MKDRGEHFGIYAALFDNADVHALSDNAFRVLFTLKGTLGAAGIDVVYTAELAERCGKTPDQVEAALRELEAEKPVSGERGWVIREQKVLWLVNGLEFTPSLSEANWKQRAFVQKLVRKLGNRPIVQLFRAKYPGWFVKAEKGAYEQWAKEGRPRATDTPTNGYGEGIEWVSNGPRSIKRSDSDSDSEDENLRRSDSEASSTRARATAAAPPSSPPPPSPPAAAPLAPLSAHADAPANRPLTGPRQPLEPLEPLEVSRVETVGKLPPGAVTLLERCYGYVVGAQLSRRQEDVAEQLLQTLTPMGARLQKREYVRARDVAHLDAVCRMIASTKLEEPDSAIRVVLLRLRDTHVAMQVESSAAAAKAEFAPTRATGRSQPTPMADVPPDVTAAAPTPPPAEPTDDEVLQFFGRPEHEKELLQIKQDVERDYAGFGGTAKLAASADRNFRARLRRAFEAHLAQREAPAPAESVHAGVTP